MATKLKSLRKLFKKLKSKVKKLFSNFIENHLCTCIAKVVRQHCENSFISFKIQNNLRTILTNAKNKINKLEKVVLQIELCRL